MFAINKKTLFAPFKMLKVFMIKTLVFTMF